MRKASVVLLLAALTALTGCPPRPIGDNVQLQFATRRQALEHVNNNLAKINAPLQYGALVSFRFKDDAGKTHSFNLNEARLTYAPSQNLLFEVRALTGTIAQFGSNADRYWLWLDVPDYKKLWWGEWKQISAQSERRLPVPPNELLDALLLRPLPESLEGGQLPIAWSDGGYHLVFVRLGGGRQPTGWREVRFAPQPPNLPSDVIDRSPDGSIVMHAQLSDYKPVGPDGPLTARSYVVTWPLSEAEMRLTVNSARFRPDLPPEGLFDFPTRWQGNVESVDAPAQLAVPGLPPPAPTTAPTTQQAPKP
jgi:hypothetical protein